MHSITIVIVDHIPIAVVVVDHFWVPEHCDMLDSIDLVVSLFFFTKFPQSTICCHYHHDIVRFLHTNNVELHIVQFSLQSIRSTNFLVLIMGDY